MSEANGNGVFEPFALSDIGNAERMIHRHGGAIRFCARWQRWLVWNVSRWEVDETGAIDRLAKDTVRWMKQQATDMMTTNSARGETLAKYANASEGNRKIRDLIERASKEEGMCVAPDALDADPWLLNVRNGTVNLRTGALRAHRRQDLITKIAPVEHDDEAECPVWHQFLDTVFAGDWELIGFIRRAVGYALTGDTSERCLFVLHGCGANGKSTMLSLLRALLGDYAACTPSDTLMARRSEGIPNDVARLKGARLVNAVESEDGRKLAEALVKRMTGGEDQLTARFMRAEWFDFKPTFKIFLATNHKPDIRGTDDAIWARIRLVPFNVVIPPEARDPGLLDRLKSELPGILAWAVQGCLEWQAGGLQVPAIVTTATEGYREEMDPLAGFIEDACVIGEGCTSSSAQLYAVYGLWCKLNGAEAASQQKFGRLLAAKGLATDRDRAGNRAWRGIGVRASEDAL